MAVIAQTGVFSFGPQAAKETVAATFYQHRATDIDLAAVSDDRLGPPEVGGIPTPTIPYRAGLLCTGGALINPRLESTLGWLLYGAVGACTTTGNLNVFGTASTGEFCHTFKFNSLTAAVPYMTMRKKIPGQLSTEISGETFMDCKVVGFTLSLPNDGLINARVDVIGRTVEYTDSTGVAAWTYGNTNMEDYQSIPIGSITAGYVQIPGYSASDMPITAAQITLQNAPLDMRQERVFGSPYIDDITVVGRALTADVVVKWQDANLYRSILTGATNATVWTAIPFVSNLDVYTRSPANVAGKSFPYELRIKAPKVMWQMVGGIRLAGNQALMMRLTGTAIASATDYCSFTLGNMETVYTWPTS